MKKIKLLVVLLFLIVYISYTYYIYHEMYSILYIPPEIYFSKDSIKVSVNDGDDVLLKGVVATDGQDGDVSASLIVEEKTRFIEENTRTVSYVAFDSDHNAVRATRKMVYKDYKIPDITLNAPLIFASQDSNFFLEERVEANSVLDGNLTSKVRILNSEDYKEGDNAIELVVNDSAGGERRIPVTCTINPNINTNLLNIELSDYLIKAKVGDRISPYDYIKDVLIRSESHPELIRSIEYNEISLSSEGVYEINYNLSYGENIASSRLVILVEGGD